MSRGSETIKPQYIAVHQTREPQCTVSNHPGAQQWSGLDVGALLRNRIGEVLRYHCVFGVAAVRILASPSCRVAEVLLALHTERTPPASPVNPGNPHPVALLELACTGPNTCHSAQVVERQIAQKLCSFRVPSAGPESPVQQRDVTDLTPGRCSHRGSRRSPRNPLCKLSSLREGSPVCPVP